MDFGAGTFKVPEIENSYNFDNARLSSMRGDFYLGLPQWNMPEWNNIFYPSDLPSKNYLEHFGKLLTCVEVSSTFYAPVASETIEKWCTTVPTGFRFLPKWPQEITHHRKMFGVREPVKEFLELLESFDKKLGASILQLPPTFSRDYTRELYEFLLQVPKDVPLTVEFRHSSWFENSRLYPKLEEYFFEQGIGTTCSDTPSRRDVFHLSMIGTNQVVRYLSDANLENDKKRLEMWKKFNLNRSGGGNLFFVLHKQDNSHTPNLIELLDSDLSNQIQEELSKGQLDLFS